MKRTGFNFNRAALALESTSARLMTTNRTTLRGPHRLDQNLQLLKQGKPLSPIHMSIDSSVIDMHQPKLAGSVYSALKNPDL